ncbi:MAG: DMT family transporter [Alphaproteobacteria bacterium]|nr:DMT family transporter [Alphaproteobacteria bacterium]
MGLKKDEGDRVLGSFAPVKGASLMIFGCGLLSLNDAAMKLAVESTPIYQAILIRGVFALIPIMLLARFQGGFKLLRWRNLRGQLKAALLWTASVFLFTWCLQFLPLAIAVVMIYTSPLFVAAMAYRIPDEKVGLRHSCAVIVGIIGVVIVVQPGSEGISWVVLVPLASAFILAIRDLGIRQLILSDNALSIHAFSNIFVSTCALFIAPLYWAQVSSIDFLLLIFAGLISGFAIFFMIEAFRFIEASSASALKISGVVWSALLGLVIWEDFLDGGQWLGVFLILISGIYVLKFRIKKE